MARHLASINCFQVCLYTIYNVSILSQSYCGSFFSRRSLRLCPIWGNATRTLRTFCFEGWRLQPCQVALIAPRVLWTIIYMIIWIQSRDLLLRSSKIQDLKHRQWWILLCRFGTSESRNLCSFVWVWPVVFCVVSAIWNWSAFSLRIFSLLTSNDNKSSHPVFCFHSCMPVTTKSRDRGDYINCISSSNSVMVWLWRLQFLVTTSRKLCWVPLCL